MVERTTVNSLGGGMLVGAEGARIGRASGVVARAARVSSKSVATRRPQRCTLAAPDGCGVASAVWLIFLVVVASRLRCRARRCGARRGLAPAPGAAPAQPAEPSSRCRRRTRARRVHRGGGSDGDDAPATHRWRVVETKAGPIMRRRVDDLHGRDWLAVWQREPHRPGGAGSATNGDGSDQGYWIADFGGAGDCLFRCLAAATKGTPSEARTVWQELDAYATAHGGARLLRWLEPAGDEALAAFVAREHARVSIYEDGALALTMQPAGSDTSWGIRLNWHKEHWSLICHDRAAAGDGAPPQGRPDERSAGVEYYEARTPVAGRLAQLGMSFDQSLRRSWLARWVEHAQAYPAEPDGAIEVFGECALERALRAATTPSGVVADPDAPGPLLDAEAFAMAHNCRVYCEAEGVWEVFAAANAPGAWSVSVGVRSRTHVALYLYWRHGDPPYPAPASEFPHARLTPYGVYEARSRPRPRRAPSGSGERASIASRARAAAQRHVGRGCELALNAGATLADATVLLPDLGARGHRLVMPCWWALQLALIWAHACHPYYAALVSFFVGLASADVTADWRRSAHAGVAYTFATHPLGVALGAVVLAATRRNTSPLLGGAAASLGRATGVRPRSSFLGACARVKGLLGDLGDRYTGSYAHAFGEGAASVPIRRRGGWAHALLRSLTGVVPERFRRVTGARLHQRDYQKAYALEEGHSGAVAGALAHAMCGMPELRLPEIEGLTLPDRVPLPPVVPDSRLTAARPTTGVVIGVYGTRGDHAPMQAIEAVLVRAGVDCTRVAPLSVKKGAADLKALEHGDAAPSTLSSATLSREVTAARRGRAVLATAAYMDKPRTATTVILEPPAGASARFLLPNAGVQLAQDLLFGPPLYGLHANADAAGCGFPSASGHPLRRAVWRPRTGRSVACYGSSGAPYTAPPHAETLPPDADHASAFREYDTVYCHGGAGTMKTAIAAGARAVSQSNILDRRWRPTGDSSVRLPRAWLWTAVSAATDGRGVYSALGRRSGWAGALAAAHVASATIVLNGLLILSRFARGAARLLAVELMVREWLGGGVDEAIEHFTGGWVHLSDARAAYADLSALVMSCIGWSGLCHVGTADDAAYNANPAGVLTAAVHDAWAPTRAQASFLELSTGFVALAPSAGRARLVLTRVGIGPLWAHVAVVCGGKTYESGMVHARNVTREATGEAYGVELGLPFSEIAAGPDPAVEPLYGAASNCVTSAYHLVTRCCPGPEGYVARAFLLLLAGYTAPAVAAVDVARGLVGERLFGRLVAGYETDASDDDTPLPERVSAPVADSARVKPTALSRRERRAAARTMAEANTVNMAAPPASALAGVESWSYAEHAAGATKWSVVADVAIQPREAALGLAQVLEALIAGRVDQRDILAVKAWLRHRTCVCGREWGAANTDDFCESCMTPVQYAHAWSRKVAFRAVMRSGCLVSKPEDAPLLCRAAALIMNRDIRVTGETPAGEALETQYYACRATDASRPAEWHAQHVTGVFASTTFMWRSGADIERVRPGSAAPSLEAAAPPPVATLAAAPRAAPTQVAKWMMAVARRSIAQLSASVELARDPVIRARGGLDADPSPPAGRTKAAWLVEFRRRFGPLTRADFESRPEVREFIVQHADDADEALAQTVARMNAYLPAGQTPLVAGRRTRAFRPLTEHPEFKARLERLARISTFKEGANCLEYLSPEAVEASVARYSGEPAPTTVSAGESAAIADAIVHRFPDFFATVDVADPALVARKMVKKYSAALPFEGCSAVDRQGRHLTLRRRRDLVRTGWMEALIASTRAALTSGDEYPSQIHHVFMKDYIVERAKLDENPAKARTIVAQSAPWYMLTKSLNYYGDKRVPQMWPETPVKVGMPLTGAGYNYVLGGITDEQQVVALDFTAADSNFTPAAIDVLARLRKHMYRGLSDEAALRAMADACLRSLQKGHMVNLLDGRGIPKDRGLSTGQASVTFDGSWTTVGMYIGALSRMWGCDPTETFKRVEMLGQGDDLTLVLQPGHRVDPAELAAVMQRMWGMPTRVEWSGMGVVGLPWLRKQVHLGSDYRADFELAGLDVPQYAILHDAESIKTRQAATLRRGGLKFAYERTLGHLLLVVHDQLLYGFLRDEAADLRARLAANPANSKWLRARRIPERAEALRRFYKPFGLPRRYTRRLSVYDVTRVASDTVLASYFGVLQTLRFVSGLSWKGERLQMGSADALPSSTLSLACAVDALVGGCRTREEYRAAVARSPLASVINVDDYWGRRPRDRDPASHSVAPLYAFSVASAVAANALARARRVRALRVPMLAYGVFTGDGAVVYGALSTPYWLADGRTSPFLASLVPRDTAYLLKRAIGFLLDLIPRDSWPAVPRGPMRHVAAGIDALGHVWRPSVIDSTAAWDFGRATTPRWDWFYNHQLRPHLERGILTVLVESATGTGKTRELPALALAHYACVIVLEPRNVLAEGVPGARLLRRGVRFEGAGLWASTYGHMLARLQGSGLGDMSSTLIICDEVHDSSPDVPMLLDSIAPRVPVVYVTATPSLCSGIVTRPPEASLETGFARPFAVVTEVADGVSVHQALAAPEVRGTQGRVLVITPRVRDAQTLANELAATGLDASVFSRQDRLRATKYIVATQIADAGVNIAGVSVVVDTGTRLVVHEGRVCIVPVDEATMKQRAGRTGRFCEGRYVCLRTPREMEVRTYPDVWLARYRRDLLAHVYNFAEVTCGVQDASALFEVCGDAPDGLSTSEWDAVLAYYLSHSSPREAFAAWGRDAARHPVIEACIDKGGTALDAAASDADALRRWVASREPLFTFIRGRVVEASNWIALREGRVVTDYASAGVVVDLKGASVLTTTSAGVRVPGLPGLAVPVGPSITLTRATTRRVVRALFSAAGIALTVADAEKHLGPVPAFPATPTDETDAEWFCAVCDWYAAATCSALLVVGATGSRVTNAGAPFDPCLTGAWVAGHRAQFFACMSNARPTLDGFSRRLARMGRTPIHAGLFIGPLTLEVSQDHWQNRYRNVDYRFETDFAAWYAGWFVPAHDAGYTGDCVRRLLAYYEPVGSLNHHATMRLVTRNVAQLAQRFAQLHSTSVCVVSFTPDGLWCTRSRFTPARSGYWTEVAWQARDGHVEALESYTRGNEAGARAHEAGDAPHVRQMWCVGRREGGFVRPHAIVEATSPGGGDWVREVAPAWYDGSVQKRITAGRRQPIHPTAAAYARALAARGAMRACDEAMALYVVRRIANGYGVIYVDPAYGASSIAASRVPEAGWIVLRRPERSRVLVTHPCGGRGFAAPARALVECEFAATHSVALAPVTQASPEAPLRRTRGVPLRAAMLWAVVLDDACFAYMRDWMPIGAHHHAMLTQAESPANRVRYVTEILRERLRRNQHDRLEAAAREVISRLRLRKWKTMRPGALRAVRDDMTLSSERLSP